MEYDVERARMAKAFSSSSWVQHDGVRSRRGKNGYSLGRSEAIALVTAFAIVVFFGFVSDEIVYCVRSSAVFYDYSFGRLLSLLVILVLVALLALSNNNNSDHNGRLTPVLAQISHFSSKFLTISLASRRRHRCKRT